MSFKHGWDDEFIFGNSKDNDITVNGHTDYVYGWGGDDVISDQRNLQFYLKDDDDFFFGGKGDDRLTSLYGDDHLYGNKGNDRFFVRNDGDVTIGGGKGEDVAFISGLKHFDIEYHGRHTILTDGRQTIDVTGVEHIREWSF